MRVYKIPASHTVCRYEFVGENYSVVAKFYADLTGRNRNYNAEKAMDREFECALVTEYVDGMRNDIIPLNFLAINHRELMVLRSFELE